jgi:hypothetical protein
MASGPLNHKGVPLARCLRSLSAKCDPAPSAEEIDQNRTEMFANFPGFRLLMIIATADTGSLHALRIQTRRLPKKTRDRLTIQQRV